MYRAYINKVTDLKKDLNESLDYINWKKIVKKDSTVFIKPNFTFPYYQKGITTNPELLKNLLEIIKNRADKVILGESDGGNHSFTADEAFEGHGMNEICGELGVELLNLSKMPSSFVEDKILDKKVKILVPDLLLDGIDSFISVPVLKVHVMTGVTLGMKNLWGCYPDTMRCMHHKNLDHKLSLLTKVINPKIVIIDGLYALDGHGPMFGEPVRLDLLLSANNPVASDLLGASVMEMPPKKINHLQISGMRAERANHVAVAAEEGLGPGSLDEIIISQDWRKFRRPFRFDKTLMDRFCVLPFNSEFISKLIFDSVFRRLIFKMSDLFIRNKVEMDMVHTFKRYGRKK